MQEKMQKLKRDSSQKEGSESASISLLGMCVWFIHSVTLYRASTMVCCCLVSQLCPTLCDPMDCRPLGSSIHGISQARILEWVAISFSRGASWPRDGSWVSWASPALQADSFTTESLGKPFYYGLGAILGIEDTVVNKTKSLLPF